MLHEEAESVIECFAKITRAETRDGHCTKIGLRAESCDECGRNSSQGAEAECSGDGDGVSGDGSTSRQIERKRSDVQQLQSIEGLTKDIDWISLKHNAKGELGQKASPNQTNVSNQHISSHEPTGHRQPTHLFRTLFASLRHP